MEGLLVGGHTEQERYGVLKWDETPAWREAEALYLA